MSAGGSARSRGGRPPWVAAAAAVEDAAPGWQLAVAGGVALAAGAAAAFILWRRWRERYWSALAQRFDIKHAERYSDGEP